jgi:2-hydroxychromene-2-carboxylate isomerase
MEIKLSIDRAPAYGIFCSSDCVIEDGADAGVDVSIFGSVVDSGGGAESGDTTEDAREKGGFGVPSFLMDCDLVWDAEQLSAIRKIISG